jgi:hypothetical protein
MNYDPDVFDLPDTFHGEFEFDGGAFLESESGSRIQAMIAEETKTVDDTALGTTTVRNVVLENADIAQFHIGADQELDMAFNLSQGNVLMTRDYRIANKVS